jgi:NitT/TauT family transport system substrate-binding protein
MRPLRTALALLVAASSLIALSACHGRAVSNGLTPVRFQADWYPQPEHGGFYTALAKGYYKDEGLDVQILPGGPYVTGTTQVAAGQVEFGMTSSDNILESIANADEPLLAVGTTMQNDPQGIMVHANSPVQTWADLEGRTVAVKPGSTWWEFIVSKFNLHHVHEVPVTFSVANFVQDPNYIQQGFVTSEPYFAAKSGAPARMLMNRDAGFNPYRVFYTSRDYARQHPDIVARFTRASIRGWKEYMVDPGPAHAMIQKLNPAMNPDWMNYSYNALKSGHFITGDPAGGDRTGQFDPARWNALYALMMELKVLKHPIDPSSAYTTQFLK